MLDWHVAKWENKTIPSSSAGRTGTNSICIFDGQLLPGFDPSQSLRDKSVDLTLHTHLDFNSAKSLSDEFAVWITRMIQVGRYSSQHCPRQKKKWKIRSTTGSTLTAHLSWVFSKSSTPFPSSTLTYPTRNSGRTSLSKPSCKALTFVPLVLKEYVMIAM